MNYQQVFPFKDLQQKSLRPHKITPHKTLFLY